ncbi:hypothetical protein Tco_1047655, partial [Tanacetum coccineum]
GHDECVGVDRHKNFGSSTVRTTLNTAVYGKMQKCFRFPESGWLMLGLLSRVVDVGFAGVLADAGKLLTKFENRLIPGTVSFTHAYDDRIYVGYTQEVCLPSANRNTGLLRADNEGDNLKWRGPCNGTRLQVLRMGTNVIEAKISGGSVGTICAIPRMVISPSDNKLSFKLNR